MYTDFDECPNCETNRYSAYLGQRLDGKYWTEMYGCDNCGHEWDGEQFESKEEESEAE